MVDTDPVTRRQVTNARRRWAAFRRPYAVGAMTAVALTVLGVPTGAVWSAIAPRARLIAVAPGQAMPADPETTAYIAADGRFAMLTMAVGVVAAIVAYALAGRRHGTAAAVGLAVGGVLGSLAAWQTGRLPSLGGYRHALHAAGVGDHLTGPLTLHARGVLVLGALAAVAAFGLIEVGVSIIRNRPDDPHPAPLPHHHPDT